MSTPTTQDLLFTELPDRELLARFGSARDEQAFQMLVARHGPLVLGVCRRVLRSEQDVEDVFQATFLALARRAGSVAWQDSVAGWLYKVAFRAAVRLRAEISKLRETELNVETMTPNDELEEIAASDAEQTLHEAILELPQQYRDAIVLCHLEGKSREEAAGQLGCSEAVVKGRLQRGRNLLLLRLGIKGLVLSAILPALQQSVEAAELTLSDALLESTASAACRYAAGHTSGGTLSPRSVTLAQGATNMMLGLALLKKASLSLALIATFWLGTVLVMGSASAYIHEGNVALDGTTTPPETPELEVVIAQAAPLISPAAGSASDPEPKAAAKPGVDQRYGENGSRSRSMRPAQFDFIDVPLQDAVDFLQDQHDVQIKFDRRAFDEGANPADLLVSLTIRSVSLRSALNRMLTDHRLCYVIKDEVLLITTPAIAAEELVPKIYKVGDLLHQDGHAGTLQELAELIAQSVIGVQTADANPTPDVKSGSIAAFRKDLLIISQTRPVHEQIELFLKELRNQSK